MLGIQGRDKNDMNRENFCAGWDSFDGQVTVSAKGVNEEAFLTLAFNIKMLLDARHKVPEAVDGVPQQPERQSGELVLGIGAY